MGNRNNPAGRLHTLLSSYLDNADTGKTVHMTWAEVLGVDEMTVPAELCAIASLIRDIDMAITRSGQDEQRHVYDTFARSWAMPIIATDHHPRQTPSPGPAVVDVGALAALGGLSAYLAMVAPDGVTPDNDSLATLHREVSALIPEVLQDPDLPLELKKVIKDRLHDILWAIDHFSVGGPGAVEEAAERLMGQVIIVSNGVVPRAGVFQKVLDVAGKVWSAFRLGPQAHDTLEGWGEIFKQLPPGP